MSLDPLLRADLAIQIHAFTAIAAFSLGLIQFAAPKGTLPHRTLGWVWVILMTLIAGSSFLIHEINLWRGWSPIHLLSIFTLATLPAIVINARKGNTASHKKAVFGLFGGALVIAGLFTFLPGRIMYDVIFGG